jgi:4-amino-4-deoxy-L-arabinose transferase-like glycosyltransferase
MTDGSIRDLSQPSGHPSRQIEVVATSVRSRLIFLFVFAFFTLALFLWWHFDHSYPFWDGAAHVKDSIAYAQLIKHAHLFKASWIKQFLTVNYDYPLTVHFINGIFKAALGFGRVSDMAAMLFYQAIFMGSMYGLSLKLGKNHLAAALAVFIACCYPLVAMLSHVPLLDYAYLAFTTLALWGIVNFDSKMDWRNALIMGICLALGATSKQISVLFLLAPCLYLLGREIKAAHAKNIARLALAGACPAFALLLWMLPNLKALAAWRDYYKNDPTLSGGVVNVFFDHLSHYLSGLIGMLSPGLLLFAIVAIVMLTSGRALRKQDIYIAFAASICGLLLLCCVGLNKPEQRYVIPLAIAPAIYSGQILAAWLKDSRLKLVALLVLLLSLTQFVLLNYAPYPINASETFMDVVYKIAGHNVSREMVEPRPAPTPGGDRWGQEWVVDQIVQAHAKETLNNPGKKGEKITLNLMPSTPDLSVHTIDLVCIFANTTIEPSTFRQFTLHGDMVRYDESALNYYQWYLLKTGYQGSPLDSQSSKDNYQKILNFVQNPENFVLHAQRDLPDGSKLQLFRRKQI